jgi:hypothetical protein
MGNKLPGSKAPIEANYTALQNAIEAGDYGMALDIYVLHNATPPQELLQDYAAKLNAEQGQDGHWIVEWYHGRPRVTCHIDEKKRGR